MLYFFFSLKREMRIVGEDCGLQPVTLAMAYVYFEKLVLQGRLNKQNRFVRILSTCKQLVIGFCFVHRLHTLLEMLVNDDYGSCVTV